MKTFTRSWDLECRENRQPLVLPDGAGNKTGAAEADLNVFISIIHGSTCIYQFFPQKSVNVYI